MSYRHVYFARAVGGDGPIKIGCSNDVRRRIEQMSNWSPVPLEALVAVPGSPTHEHALHRRFAHLRLHGEWFAPHPDLLAHIETLLRAPQAEDAA